MSDQFVSENPATGKVIWEGASATQHEVNAAVDRARAMFPSWSTLSLENRLQYLENFCTILTKERSGLARMLSEENGKPLWEADLEIGSMINKLPISLQAHRERCPDKKESGSQGTSRVMHKPHGVLGILGPFNFPGHLPNGHMMPALLAGNTIVFKPSELTPMISEKIIDCWNRAGLPAGVLNLIQGGGETGRYLAEHQDLDGLMFTGSFKVGHSLAKLYAERSSKILALEMGGNNPLIVHEVRDLKAAVYHILVSAYITAGQRCTCARRLIIPRAAVGRELVQLLIQAISNIVVGAFTDKPEPFMGPLISNHAAREVMSAYEALENAGGIPLVPLKRPDKALPFLTPGLMDVTAIQNRKDEEIFGPLLQLIWVDNFEEALQEANRTHYGLAAGLLSDNEKAYELFVNTVKAGIMHWNRPLTGASSQAPFGGIKDSGNYHPSAYYAADYCSYPVAGLLDSTLKFPDTLLPGLT